MISAGVAAPHMGEVVDWRSFFSSDFSGKRTANPEHILYTSRRGIGQGCAFWGSLRYVSSYGGVIPPKPLILGRSMGISSLNVYGLIWAQEKRITTHDSSKCASRQDTQCALIKTKGWGHCRGPAYKTMFQRQIYSQISKHSRKC
jgi:hypothetical protein